MRRHALVITNAPSFRDGPQRAHTCCRLLGLVGASDRWTSTGPTPEARAALDRSAGPDAQRILAACWAIWDGSATLGLNELLLLKPEHLEAVGELLAAMATGATAIDDWLVRWEPRCRPPPAILPHPAVARRRARRGL